MSFGLVLLPWSAGLLSRPSFLDDKGIAVEAFNFLAYHFSGQFLFFGFVVALGSLCWFVYMRNWRAVVQSLFEMVACVGAAFLVAAY